MKTLTRTSDSSGKFSTVRTRDADGFETAYRHSFGSQETTFQVTNSHGRMSEEIDDHRYTTVTKPADGRVITQTFVNDPVAGSSGRYPSRTAIEYATGNIVELHRRRSVTKAPDGTPAVRYYQQVLGPRPEPYIPLIHPWVIAWNTKDDLLNRVVTSVSPDGYTTTVRYNPAGQVTDYTGPGLFSIHFDRDAHGRVFRATQQDRSVDIVYGSDGFPASISGADGRTMTLEHDIAGRLLSSGSAEAKAHFRYDAVGRVVGFIPPASPEHTWMRSAKGLITGYSEAAEPQESYEHTPAGRPKGSTLPDGRGIQVRYSRYFNASTVEVAVTDSSAGTGTRTTMSATGDFEFGIPSRQDEERVNTTASQPSDAWSGLSMSLAVHFVAERAAR